MQKQTYFESSICNSSLHEICTGGDFHPFKFDQELKFCIISSIATVSDRCAVKGGCNCYMSHHGSPRLI